MIRQTLYVMVMLISCTNHAAIVLKGDEQASSGQTFSFRVQDYKQSNAIGMTGTHLYVAAHPDDGGADIIKNFAVSRVSRDSNQFVGLTPEKVKFNASAEQIGNPLYDKGIAFMALFNGEGSILTGAAERPVVVTSSDRKTIYFINMFSATGTNVHVIAARNNDQIVQNVPDDTAAITAGIVGIESASPFVFAAVRPTAGVFGATGSGVALVSVQQSASIGSFTGPLIVDAPTGDFARTGGNRALPINVTLDDLKIGSDLASIGTVVDLHWHSSVGNIRENRQQGETFYDGRLFVSLQITGGAAGTDGGRALLIGRVTPASVLEFYPIAPTAAFDGAGDKIVGAVGASASVSINKIRSMFSSTGLPYLIVQGNVGAPAAVARSVFALPLVSGQTGDDIGLNGSIADKNADPTDVFTPTTIPVFSHRKIATAATTPAQMPLSTDAATRVGGGDVFDGDITDIYVHEDAVYVTVKTSDVNDKPGVFYSRALFESNGKIKAWSTWQRAAGTINKVQSAVLDPITGKYSTLVANSSNEVKTVKRTEWAGGDGDGFASPVTIAEQFFSQQEGGIQGLHNFVVTASGQSTETPGLLDISALVATGLKKVMLIQTSTVSGGGVIPITAAGFGGQTAFTGGQITQTLPNGDSKIISISGGVLDDIGPITAAEIAKDGTAGSNGYLFVGGSHGVAVLSKADGAGWDTATGLSTGFTGLTAGMSFKMVGNYSNVKKLINDGQFLYVLTGTTLDRIDLTAGNVGLGTVTPTTIATPESVPGITATGSFLDAIISQQLLLLGTNQGLLRIGNGLDVRTVDNNSISWQRIDAPESVGPIQQLHAVTISNRTQNCASDSNGSNLLVLSGYRGKDQAQLIRYTINPVTATGVIDSTVEKINDLYVQFRPSYFANFGQFRNLTGTDGALYFGARSKQRQDDPLITTFFADGGVQTGSRFLTNKIIPIDFAGTDLIAAMLQSSATGSWLVAGDGGIKANE